MIAQLQGLQKLGAGAFSTAYKKNAKTCLVYSTCYMKECMSLGWFPKNRLFPVVARLEFGLGPQGEHALYSMPLLRRVTAPTTQLNATSLKLYRELRKVAADFSLEYSRDAISYGVVIGSNFSACLKKHVTSHAKREALQDAYAACNSYSLSIVFECSPRNIAVSPSGGLILADCFYCAEQLQRIRQAKRTFNQYH